MILFLLITALLIGGFVFLLVNDNTKEIAGNWPKYRCSPTVMPFAALYGHNTAENFNFCMANIFQTQASGLMTPITGILGVIISSIQTFIESINSLRIQLATLVGGVSRIAQDFSDRVSQIMMNMKITSMRMRMLMGRMFATFYAIVFMGMSGITAVLNFGDTFLFKFLDTFCFPPETPVEIEGYSSPIPISDVRVGDRFKNGKKITATFAFLSDGQPMVELTNTHLQVSTNHYIEWNGRWIQAKDHPQAIPVGPWGGGARRPLICLNTEDHILPIGGYRFLDYDETETGDRETMRWVEERVNNGLRKNVKQPIEEYSPSIWGETEVKLYGGAVKRAKDIQLGDHLTTGKVMGRIQKEVWRSCTLCENTVVAEATLVWDSEERTWVRATNAYAPRASQKETPDIFYSFVVSPTAQIELASGHRIRDYVEVHSPETEHIYAEKVSKSDAFLNSERVVAVR